MSQQQPIIAVVGATGAQGGGLVRAILDDPQQRFAARALTRRPDSEQAQALARLGAEVVAVDLDEPKSIRRGFDGCHGAFCVTNFWEHFSPAREQAQARSMAQAAKDCGLNHVVWSTLEDTRRWIPLDDESMPTLQGQYKVPHFDGKGAIDHVFTDLTVPTTFLRVPFYWDNLIHFGMGPKPMPGGALQFILPLADQYLPGIASEDIGRCTFGIFSAGRRYLGETVGIAGETLNGHEMAATLSQNLQRPVHYQAITPADYRALGFPGADDLGNMFQFQLQFNDMFCGSRSVVTSRALNSGLLSFSDWLQRNKQRIPLN